MTEKHISLKKLGIADMEILEAILGVFKHDGYKVRLDFNLETNELDLVIPSEDAKRIHETVSKVFEATHKVKAT